MERIRNSTIQTWNLEKHFAARNKLKWKKIVIKLYYSKLEKAMKFASEEKNLQVELFLSNEISVSTKQNRTEVKYQM